MDTILALLDRMFGEVPVQWFFTLLAILLFSWAVRHVWMSITDKTSEKQARRREPRTPNDTWID